MSVSLQLRFPWIHINGKVQEIEVSEEIDIAQDIQLIKVIEQEESTFDPQIVGCSESAAIQRSFV